MALNDHAWLRASLYFAVDVIYAVNGQTYSVSEVLGFTVELSGNIVEKWSPDGLVLKLFFKILIFSILIFNNNFLNNHNNITNSIKDKNVDAVYGAPCRDSGCPMTLQCPPMAPVFMWGRSDPTEWPNSEESEGEYQSEGVNVKLMCSVLFCTSLIELVGNRGGGS